MASKHKAGSQYLRREAIEVTAHLPSATAIVALFALACATHAAGELKCVQSPTFFMVGQQTRYVIETPPDCGELTVRLPGGLELFDRWPYKPGDTRQRFYVRAKEPLKDSAIIFEAGEYSLTVPVEVLSWAEAQEPRKLGEMDLPRIFPMDRKDEHKSGLSFLTQESLDKLRAQGADTDPEPLVAALPPDDQAFYGLPETTIPRAVFVQHYQLKQAVRDADGDGVTRFVIYDYGPGDRTMVPGVVSIERTGPGAYETTANSTAAEISLPQGA